MENIAAHFRACVDEQMMHELASSLTFMKETVEEELETALDNYLHEEVGQPLEALVEAHTELVDAHNQLLEAHNHLFDLVTQGMSQEERERWYREVSQSARGDATDYPWKGAPNLNGSIPDSEAERNRNSAKPSGGRNYGTQGIREGLEEGTSSYPAVDPRIQRYVDIAERQAGILPPDEPSNVVALYCEHANREAADPALALTRGSGWQGK